MNMNKTEKLLAARKRLKEFQQSKNHNHDNASGQQKDQQKPMPVESPQRHVESPLAASAPHSPEKRAAETPAAVQKICEVPLDIDVTSLDDSRLAEEATEVKHHPEGDDTETASSLANPVEKQDEAMRQPEARINFDGVPSRVPPQRILPSPPASPSPPRSPTADNDCEDSPPSRVERLLRMGSAVADAMAVGAECAPAISREVDHEYRNQFLASCVEQQKQLVDQLRGQASQWGARVSELETELARKDEEFAARLSRELSALKEELGVHARTTEILVAEKAELTAANERHRVASERAIAELDELNERLKASQARIAELEREASHARSIVDETRATYQRLHLDYAELEKRHNELSKSREDDELETSELRREVSLRNAEIASLRRELVEKNTQLSLNELKIQQLTSTPQEIQALDGHHQALACLEEQLTESREALKTLSRERDEAAKQYENYVRQLDARHENALKELEDSRVSLRALEAQEKSYIQRMSDLEQSLQRERQTVEKLSALEGHEQRIEHLTASLDALSLEHANLQTSLNERDAEIETLKRDLEEARESREDTVDKVKLASALESEKLGASRAVAQNQQLKAQLNEMHDAFVTLSNSKLDLTEQLQAERTIGKKLNAHLNKVEEEMDELKEQLRLKTLALEDAEREKLQTAQIADQMHHYQAQSNQARTLEQELQNTLGCVEILRRENQQLSMELNALKYGDNPARDLANGDERLGDENDSARKHSIVITAGGGSMISDPAKKLEIRFKETMERVAELTDEKQRLEHLVLQLQGETETIGEYITLYQKQRGILQRKAKERDENFRQLVEQRNHQQEQLHQLKVLVAQLLRKKSSNSSNPPSLDADNKSPAIIEFENEHHETVLPESDERPNDETPRIDPTDKTTSKILDLLSEIKDCKDTCILEPNFHPCPWCSGKLITV